MEPDAVELRVAGCLVEKQRTIPDAYPLSLNAQTPGELKQRTERLHPFAGLPEVQETLERLFERGLVIRHPRRPGQKEDRFEQTLGGGGEIQVEEPDPAYLSPAVAADDDRLERLERELQDLRAEVARLRETLGG